MFRRIYISWENAKLLAALPGSILKGSVYKIPNVWIAADLMRGGDLIDRAVNLGGSIGVLAGTDVFTNGFKVVKPAKFGDLIKAITENSGCIWGLALFAHGSKNGDIGSYANITGMAYTGKVEGNVSEIISAITQGGYKIAKAYPSQCYSGYEGEVSRGEDDYNPSHREKLENALNQAGSAYKIRKSPQTPGFTWYSYNVDWETAWKGVAVYVHTYKGINAVWLLDIPI